MLVFGTLQRLVACEFQGSDWTSDKQISRTFLGFFKDKLQFSRTKIYLINWHSFTSPRPHPKPFWSPYCGLNTSWSHLRLLRLPPLCSHFFILLSATRLRKMTGYDLQLHLRYRNSIWNKGTEIIYCWRTKIFLRYPWVLQVLLLALRMSPIFLGKIIKDFLIPNKEIKYFLRT